MRKALAGFGSLVPLSCISYNVFILFIGRALEWEFVKGRASGDAVQGNEMILLWALLYAVYLQLKDLFPDRASAPVSSAENVEKAPAA